MKTSKDGILLLKSFEGCRLTAYPDAGGYSIGYGHHGVAAGAAITQAQAEELLRQDLAAYERVVDSIGAALNQQQFDACVSLAYNIGSGNFKSSTVARLLKQSAEPRQELAEAWAMWRMSGSAVNQALVARRQAEYSYYASTQNKTKAMPAVVAAVMVGAAALLLLSN